MNPPEQPLRVSDSNSAQDFPGLILGIQVPLFRGVIAALAVGVALFAWLESKTDLGTTTALFLSLAPAAGCALFVMFFFQGKPPGYARDLAESLTTRGSSSPLERRGVAPMFSPFPDGYLHDDLLVFGSPNSGGQVAMGFWIEAPSLHHASNAERNRFHDQTRQLLRLLPEGFTLQFQWWVDSDYQAPLRRYQQATENSTNALTKRLRNLNFLWHWNRLGSLRRERVAIFIGRTIKSPGAPWQRAKAESHHAVQLEQLRIELSELGKQMAALLRGQGGRVVPMTGADVARLWSRKLNPSQAKNTEFDPAAHFNCELSLLDQFWNGELRGQGARGFFLDDMYHGALLLKRWPSQTVPALIHRLTQLPFGDYDLTAQVERLDDIVAREQRELDRMHQQLAHKHDERLAVACAKKQERIRRLSEGAILALSVQFIIVVRGRTPEELSERMLALKSAVAGMNAAACHDCTLPASARRAFANTLPGWMNGPASLKLYAEDSFAADMLPLGSSSFTGHLESAEAILPGTNGNLIGIKLFAGEGEFATPQNALIIGSTGVGKSELIRRLMQETEPHYQFHAIIEEGLSQAQFTRSFGIEPIIIRPDGRETFNCFDTRRLPNSSFQRASITALVSRMAGLPADEDKARKRSALIAKMVARLGQEHALDKLRSWPEEKRLAVAREAMAVAQCSKEKNLPFMDAFLHLREWTRTEPEAVAAYQGQFSEQAVRDYSFGCDEALLDLVFAHLPPDEHLTLSSLRDYLELNAEGAEAEECQWIATLLVPFCRGGNCGVLFDGASNVSFRGRVVHIELGQIPESARELKALIGLVVMNDLRQHLLSLPLAMRKMVVVEEVARFLDVPGGERILREFYQSFRKHNTVVVALMQQFAQIADSPIRAALVGNSRVFVIFNPGDRQDAERLAHDIGLPAVAVETILRYPRPDQQTGAKYAEFLYVHTDPNQTICGTVRNIRLPDDGHTQ